MRLLGDPENAGTFFAHSLVLCDADGAKAAEDKASSRGDVTGFPLGIEGTELSSGGCNWGGGTLAFELAFLEIILV